MHIEDYQNARRIDMFKKLNYVLAVVLAMTILFVFGSCGDDPASSENKVPTLTTANVTEITSTTAACGGTNIVGGASEVTARGVCWSTNPSPTVADSKTTDGYGTDDFTSSITGLTYNTSYYVRAYATNSIGTGYGVSRPFTTDDENPVGTVSDIDGNTYATIKIGNQWWMAENLKVTHYRNGDSIPNITDGAAWAGLATGAYCEYNNDPNNVATYGRLYNWYAVNDSRNIAPTGWRVPTDAQWQFLIDRLGGDDVAGGKMKETGTVHWDSPNTGATNESGFSALPGGSRWINLSSGVYISMGTLTGFWSSTEENSSNAWCRALYYNKIEVVHSNLTIKLYGFSIRCVKDQ
jgi:uncharacterized protein (TIGR02145 family)